MFEYLQQNIQTSKFDPTNYAYSYAYQVCVKGLKIVNIKRIRKGDNLYDSKSNQISRNVD